jgi:hypothetical protein
MITLLEMCQLESPQWAALSQGFQDMVYSERLYQNAQMEI